MFSYWNIRCIFATKKHKLLKSNVRASLADWRRSDVDAVVFVVAVLMLDCLTYIVWQDGWMSTSFNFCKRKCFLSLRSLLASINLLMARSLAVVFCSDDNALSQKMQTSPSIVNSTVVLYL